MEIPKLTAARAKAIAAIIEMQSPFYAPAIKQLIVPAARLWIAIIENALFDLAKTRRTKKPKKENYASDIYYNRAMVQWLNQQRRLCDAWEYLTTDRIDEPAELLMIDPAWIKNKILSLADKKYSDESYTKPCRKPPIVWPVVSSLVR